VDAADVAIEVEGVGAMTFLVERIAELHRYLAHLRHIRPKVSGREELETDLSLRNDVVHSLLVIAQLVIDIAGELSANRAERFETYRHAIANLARDPRFPKDLVDSLEPLAGFRNVVVHEYISVDTGLVMEALDNLEPIERFEEIVRHILTPPARPDPETP
jgi:uncharacterized protein YutE (UPF0331/DUF86 family)